jgi:hypothetical protein
VTGLEPFASVPVVVAAGEKRELPVVAMRIATKTTKVDVVATLNDVAQAQVNSEEKQRILGFLPNYYTSYIWNAAPMTRKLKLNLALRTAADPVTFLVVGGVAGVEQAHKTFPGYGQGFEGYAKRYGASYADTVSSRMFGSAIFPVLLASGPTILLSGVGQHAFATALCACVDLRLQRRRRPPGTELLSRAWQLHCSWSLEFISSSAGPEREPDLSERLDHHRRRSCGECPSGVSFAKADPECACICEGQAVAVCLIAADWIMIFVTLASHTAM